MAFFANAFITILKWSYRDEKQAIGRLHGNPVCGSRLWAGGRAAAAISRNCHSVGHERSECKPDRAQQSSHERSECKPDRAQQSRKDERSECKPDAKRKRDSAQP